MKNSWLLKILKEVEDNRFHGKVILNFHDGDVPNIEKYERINKSNKDGVVNLKMENTK